MERLLYVPDSIATSRAVHLDLSCVRREVLGRVLGGDAALESEAASRDVVLSETELFQGSTRSDLNLRSDDVDAGDLLGDGVLHLNARVDPTAMLVQALRQRRRILNL
jgi:hypothetical protein